MTNAYNATRPRKHDRGFIDARERKASQERERVILEGVEREHERQRNQVREAIHGGQK